MKFVLLFIFLVLWGQIAGAQAVITNEKNIFTIDVNESGDALWTVERNKPLTTQSEINEWEIILNNQSKYKTYKIAEFSDPINRSLRSAENYSNRSMDAENFNISYDMVKTVPSAYGIIRFSFEWKNFSRTKSSKIYIGDAFSEGFVPSPDNVLVIKIPPGYNITNVSPSFDKRDGDRLIWDGTLYRSFGKGEPSLVLSRIAISTVAAEPPATDKYKWYMIIVITIILLSSTVLVFWKKKPFPIYSKKGNTAESVVLTYGGNEALRKDNIETNANGTGNTGTGAVIIDNAGISTAQTENAGGNGSNISQTLLPDLETELLGDEEMIERHLTKFGGQAYQSDIVKESGLSKSKISIVLAKMKEDGRIIKIRKGKENIIRLVVKK